MKHKVLQSTLENNFKKAVANDKRIKNAYLLVASKKLNLHFNLAQGKIGKTQAHIDQPVHLASVGKLFTATLISILVEKEQLNFNDPISKFLDHN